jgi:hypothetical protein
MQLGDADAEVGLVAMRETYADDKVGDDVWATVSFRNADFSGLVATVVGRDEWETFARQVNALERDRRGEAVLLSAYPDEVRLRLFASSTTGAMAVEGHLQRVGAAGTPALDFGPIAFDPGLLAKLLQELRANVP